MDASGILELVRDRLDDDIVPYRWSTTVLVSHLNDTVDEFCERTGVIRNESEVAVTQITLAANTTEYTLSPLITRILWARTNSNNDPISVKDVEWMDANISSWRTSTMTGSSYPTCIIPDSTYGKIRIYPYYAVGATVTEKINLTVEKRQTTEITGSDLTVSPPIPTRYHRGLVAGIAKRAYRKDDPETYNQGAFSLASDEWDEVLSNAKLNIVELRTTEGVCTPHYGAI
jgi:hypothetical protein